MGLWRRRPEDARLGSEVAAAAIEFVNEQRMRVGHTGPFELYSMALPTGEMILTVECSGRLAKRIPATLVGCRVFVRVPGRGPST